MTFESGECIDCVDATTHEEAVTLLQASNSGRLVRAEDVIDEQTHLSKEAIHTARCLASVEHAQHLAPGVVTLLHKNACQTSDSKWKSRYLAERELREEYERRLFTGRAYAIGAVCFICFMCFVWSFLEGLDFISSL